MNDAVIIENLSKEFKIDIQPLTMFNLCKRFFVREKIRQAIWALKDINLHIQAGQRVGIIGDNGSGKTTLLRMIAGLYRPTCGSVRVSCQPAPFLQMGIGMERDLTALQNIFLFGAILGIPRHKIESELDEIIQFAEIEKFIHCPLRDFSSGMIQRVAFSIARHVETDILLLDEMLATGDIGFRQKCFLIIEDYIRTAKTVILTSHEPEMIRHFCTHCLWLDKGLARAYGPAGNVLDAYIFSKKHT